MKNYLFYQQAIGCYDKGTGAAKSSVCAGLTFLSLKGFMKVKYRTFSGPSIRADDALYKPNKGYSKQQIIQMLKDYIIRSGAPVYWGENL